MPAGWGGGGGGHSYLTEDMFVRQTKILDPLQTNGREFRKYLPYNARE